MKGAWNRLKAASGMAMSALFRVFAPGDEERCGEHGVRLRTMTPQGGYRPRGGLCPVCERRTVKMRAYPFKMYFSARGLIWSAAILSVVFGVIPQVRTAFRNRAESTALAEEAEAEALAEALDSMAPEWVSMYRMLEKVHVHKRAEAFMDFVTGSREVDADDRSPIVVSMPKLSQDGGALFMGLFWIHERDEIMPIVAELSAKAQGAP